MDTHLAVTLTRSFDRRPLAVVHNLPGLDADLFPSQLRALANALHQAADACDAAAPVPALIKGRHQEFALNPQPSGVLAALKELHRVCLTCDAEQIDCNPPSEGEYQAAMAAAEAAMRSAGAAQPVTA